MKYIIHYILMGLTTWQGFAQETTYGKNQPFASFWFVEELLEWSPEADLNAAFNTSFVPLADRFINDTIILSNKVVKIPGIISLVAPHTTSKHPSQGFPSVKQYAFPFWQYIDYLVQWGGSSGEGIIVPPLATWTDAAHKNGVKSIGTVFFPPNVYGGKEEWVYHFLEKNDDGSFPVADKLIEVANTYNFDGWFINQETYNLKSGTAELMIEFIAYYRQNSSLKLVWYDSMIDDSRVIWQDELNDHNKVFFQKGKQSMSDVFFVNFKYHEINLEDSKQLAQKLGRSEWDIFAGIDVQAKGAKTPVHWEALFDQNGPKNTSVGLYWPNSTFDLSKTKQPEDVYSNEQKFWNGGPTYETVYGTKKWLGFSDYFEPRSVINKLPFKTNFNYGLGRFYKEKGETVSAKEWHNLSIQDVLPTWQWKVDSTKVKPTISFDNSYDGGSSLLFESKGNAKVPLYKTNIQLDQSVKFEIVTKSDAEVYLQFYCKFSNGEELTFPLRQSNTWKKSKFTVLTKPNASIVEIGIYTVGKGNALLGEISVFYKKEKKLQAPKFSAEVFPNGDTAEIFIHFQKTSNAKFHNIYMLSSANKKIWLGKTPSQDYYIAEAPLDKDKGILTLIVEPVATGGTKGKSAHQKIPVKS